MPSESDQRSRSSIPADIRRAILIESGHKCAVCGADASLQFAHIVPWHRCRSHELGNIICLCANCHQRADKEKWGRKTLLAYKSNPWVHHNSRAVPKSSVTTDVEVTIKMSLEDFDKTAERMLKYSLSGFLEISPGLVEIVKREAGSVKVTVRLPSEEARRFLAAYASESAEFQSSMMPFFFLEVKIVTTLPRLTKRLPASQENVERKTQASHRLRKQYRVIAKLKALFQKMAGRRLDETKGRYLMRPATELDPVIREVPPGASPEQLNQEVVAIDARTGEAIPQQGLRIQLIRLFGQVRRTFLVTNANAPRALAVRQGLRVPIASFGRSFEVPLDYQVRCPPKSEEAVAEALGRGVTPQEELELMLEKWTRTFLEGREAEFLSDPRLLVSELEDFLTDRARRNTSLSLEVRVHIEKLQGVTSRKTVGPMHITVRPIAVQSDVDLHVEFEIEVDPTRKLVAFTVGERIDDLVQRLPELLADHLSHHASLQQLYAELETTVRASAEEFLADLLAGHGYTLGLLQLDGGPVVPGVVSETEVHWHRDLSLRDDPNSQRIELRAWMHLGDLDAFVRAGVQDLDEWIDSVMARFTQEQLLGLNYVQLRHRQDEIQARVAEEIKTQAIEVGYQARPEIHLPGLPLPEMGAKRVLQTVSYSFPDSGNTIEIVGEFLLEVADIDHYTAVGAPTAAGTPDLTSWAAREFNQAATEVLFGRIFMEVCRSYGEIRTGIVAQMQDRAVAAGLEIEQIIQIVGLSALPLKRVAYQLPLSLTGWTTPVILHVEALFALAATEIFDAAGPSDLEIWAQREIEEATAEIFFGLVPSALILNRAAIEESLGERLRAAAEKIGYEVKLRTKFQGLPVLESAASLQGRQQVTVTGNANPLQLTWEVKLELSEADEYLKAGAPALDSWTRQTLDQILNEEFFNTSFTELCLRREEITAGIAARLRDMAHGIGYRLESHYRIDGLLDLPTVCKIEVGSLHNLVGWSDQLDVKVELLLRIQDAARYAESGAPDLVAWSRQAAEEEVTVCIFGISFATFYREQERRLAEICQRLQARGKDFGFDIQPAVTIPALKVAIPQAVTHELRLGLQLRQHSEPIELRGQISLRIDDHVRFVSEGCPDLAVWWRRQLEEATNTDFFSLTYAEFCLSYREKLADLSEKLRRAAQAIGYLAEVSLVTSIDPDEVRFHEVKYRMLVPLVDVTEGVELDADLRLELVDEGRFLASDITDVPSWGRRQVQIVTGEVLFGLTHAELSVMRRDRQQMIEEAVTEKVKAIGYVLDSRVTLLGLDDSLLEPHAITHSFSCRVIGYAKPLQIQTELILQVMEPVTYCEQGCPSLDSWGLGHLRNITSNYLNSVRYIDLCIDLERHKAAIEGIVRKEAFAIGCRVKQLTIITDLLLERLRKGLSVEFEGDFLTLSGVNVGLVFKAHVRIRNLERLRETLEDHAELLEYMEATIRQGLEQLIRQMDPAGFYTEFQEPITDNEPINKRIEAFASQLLEERFYAEVLDISCRQRETEISGTIEKLARKLHAFQVKVERVGGEPDMQFQGTLRVVGIPSPHAWHTFRLVQPRPERLIQRTVEHLSSLLMDESFEYLVQTRNAELQEEIQGPLRERLINDFGVEMMISDWRREAMEIEKEFARERYELQSNSLKAAKGLQKQITGLRGQLYNMIADGLDDQKVEELQARIQVLDEEEARMQKSQSVVAFRLQSDSSEPALALGEGLTQE